MVASWDTASFTDPISGSLGFSAAALGTGSNHTANPLNFLGLFFTHPCLPVSSSLPKGRALHFFPINFRSAFQPQGSFEFALAFHILTVNLGLI